MDHDDSMNRRYLGSAISALRSWLAGVGAPSRRSGVSTEEWRSAANTWEALARSDPLWAVLSEPDKRARRWKVDAFFKTGEELVERVLSRAEAANARIKYGLAVDFGCGVGRLSRAFAHRFDKVMGIDISPTMIAIARELNRDHANLSFHLNQRSDLRFLPDAYADFVCSHITLQHLQPDLAEGYICELFRIARPGAYVYFQLPSHLVSSDSEASLAAEDCRAALCIKSAPTALWPGAAGDVVVQVRNATSVDWRVPLHLGNHWRTLDGKVERYDDGRSALPSLDGGDSVDIVLPIAAPAEPGVYRLDVDIVQEGVRWFADVGSPITSVSVRVETEAQERGPIHVPLGIANNIDSVYTPAPAFEMHGIHRSRIEAIARKCGMRLIRCDDYTTDWLSHEYVFAKPI